MQPSLLTASCHDNELLYSAPTTTLTSLVKKHRWTHDGNLQYLFIIIDNETSSYLNWNKLTVGVVVIQSFILNLVSAIFVLWILFQLLRTCCCFRTCVLYSGKNYEMRRNAASKLTVLWAWKKSEAHKILAILVFWCCPIDSNSGPHLLRQIWGNIYELDMREN